MKLAPENSIRHAPRRGRGSGRRRARSTGGVLHAVGSRSEAVRLAPVVTALRAQRRPAGRRPPRRRRGERRRRLRRRRAPAHRGAGRVATPSADVQRTAHALAGGRAHAARARGPRWSCSAATPTSRWPSRSPPPSSASRSPASAAGLRCGDFSLSEEINRIADRPPRRRRCSPTATRPRDALECEGIDADAGPPRRQHRDRPAAPLRGRRPQRRAAWRRFGVAARRLRAGDAAPPRERRATSCAVARIADALAGSPRATPVVLPLHPATRAPAGARRATSSACATAGVHVTEPLGYLDFLSLEQSAGAILTDSGGVQDEASALGVRCYTLRRATERAASRSRTAPTCCSATTRARSPRSGWTTRPATPAAIPLWDGQASRARRRSSSAAG